MERSSHNPRAPWGKQVVTKPSDNLAAGCIIFFYLSILWKHGEPSHDTTITAGKDAKLEACIGPQEGAMSQVKERIAAECYRRAGDYKRLYARASSLDEREMYLSTRREFLRLAASLEKTRPKTKRSG